MYVNGVSVLSWGELYPLANIVDLCELLPFSISQKLSKVYIFLKMEKIVEETVEIIDSVCYNRYNA